MPPFFSAMRLNAGNLYLRNETMYIDVECISIKDHIDLAYYVWDYGTPKEFNFRLDNKVFKLDSNGTITFYY